MAFWDQPVVCLWAVKDSQLTPIGGAWLVSNALLTAGHVVDALEVLEAQGARIDASRCWREVTTVSNMVQK